jgi:hypothetical protein
VHELTGVAAARSSSQLHQNEEEGPPVLIVGFSGKCGGRGMPTTGRNKQRWRQSLWS